MAKEKAEKSKLFYEVKAVKAMLEHAYFSAEDVGAKKLADAILLALEEAEFVLRFDSLQTHKS